MCYRDFGKATFNASKKLRCHYNFDKLSVHSNVHFVLAKLVIENNLLNISLRLSGPSNKTHDQPF